MARPILGPVRSLSLPLIGSGRFEQRCFEWRDRSSDRSALSPPLIGSGLFEQQCFEWRDRSSDRFPDRIPRSPSWVGLECFFWGGDILFGAIDPRTGPLRPHEVLSKRWFVYITGGLEGLCCGWAFLVLRGIFFLYPGGDVAPAPPPVYRARVHGGHRE